MSCSVSFRNKFNKTEESNCEKFLAQFSNCYWRVLRDVNIRSDRASFYFNSISIGALRPIVECALKQIPAMRFARDRLNTCSSSCMNFHERLITRIFPGTSCICSLKCGLEFHRFMNHYYEGFRYSK